MYVARENGRDNVKTLEIIKHVAAHNDAGCTAYDQFVLRVNERPVLEMNYAELIILRQALKRIELAAYGPGACYSPDSASVRYILTGVEGER